MFDQFVHVSRHETVPAMTYRVWTVINKMHISQTGTRRGLAVSFRRGAV